MNLYNHTILRIKTMPIKLVINNNLKRKSNFSFNVTCVYDFLKHLEIFEENSFLQVSKSFTSSMRIDSNLGKIIKTHIIH